MNPLKSLADHGQAVWLDFLSRGFIAKGGLKKLADDDGLRGVTSNPSIFEQAIGHSDEYDAAIARMLGAQDRSVGEIFEHLAVEDIQQATDVLRPTYEATHGADGYVSIEVSPYLAHKTKESIDEARRLWKAVNRENVMIKIPGTAEGLPAIQQLIGEGININITLLFSQKVYEQVAEAYVAGVEQLAKTGGNVKKMASVASFFISRIDSLVDSLLEAYAAGHRLFGENRVQEAMSRWPLQGLTVIHRFGRIEPGQNIVLVLTASQHRQAAFEAAEFLMDYLKTSAPFWKQEEGAKDTKWIEARAHDDAAAARWTKS